MQGSVDFIGLLKILSYAKPVIPRPVRRLVVGIRSLFAGFLFRSDGCFSFVGTVPPTAYFLSTATKSMQKAPFEADGFKSSFAFKSFARYGPRELTQQQARCRSRSGEGACGSMVGSRDSHSQRSHWLWQSVPHGRASGFFNCPRSGSVSRNTPIPCFGGIQDAALAHKKGSLET